MKIAWQFWLPWQPFMKKFTWHFLCNHWANFNEISYLAFMWWIYNTKLQWVMIRNSRWAPCPYMVKTIQMTSSPEPPGGWSWYFAGSIWGTSLYKIAGWIIKKPWVGGVKLGKMTQNFRYMNPWARKLIFHRNIKDNILITYMKFLWKLHGNFGCHGNRTWKNLNGIFYETTETILMKFHI